MSIWNPCVRRDGGTTCGASSAPAGRPPSSGPSLRGRPYAPGTAISAASTATAARQVGADRTDIAIFLRGASLRKRPKFFPAHLQLETLRDPNHTASGVSRKGSVLPPGLGLGRAALCRRLASCLFQWQSALSRLFRKEPIRQHPHDRYGERRRRSPPEGIPHGGITRERKRSPAQTTAKRPPQARRGRFFCLPRAMPISPSGISLVMTEPAPMSVSAPTRTGATSAVLLPMKARSPMRVWNLFLPS